MTRTYILTIKPKANTFVSMDELRRRLREIVRSGAIPSSEYSSYVGYELDSLKRLHLHTIVTTENTISYAKIATQLNAESKFHHHLKTVKNGDIQRALAYCIKEKYPTIREEESNEHHLGRRLNRVRLV